MWPWKKKIKPRTGRRVLVLIDWDNLFDGLQKRFGPAEIRIGDRLQKTMDWVRNEIGEPIEGYGFVFAPEHQSVIYQKLCIKNNLRLVTCPKRDSPDKDGSYDTVDETIIWFGKMMLNHPSVQFICIVSGDKHYMPLMEAARKKGVKIALAAPTSGSLAKKEDILRRILGLVDIHPVTQKQMLIKLETL